MMIILIPVILAVLLGPGVGQLYNREFKKGFMLIALSVILLVAFSAWLARAAMAYLPHDINTVDRALLRTIIQTHIVGDHPVTFYTYELLLGALWLYGIVDAYLGAVDYERAITAYKTSLSQNEKGSAALFMYLGRAYTLGVVLTMKTS